MATLDELVVRIKADASQLDRELKRVGGTVQQSAGRMSQAVGGLKANLIALVPALGVAAFVAFTKGAVAAADALNDLSDRTGVSASFLSAMRTEVENSGGTVEQFAQSLFMMNRQLGEAIKDAEGPAAQAFQQLGLTISDLINNKPEENFRIIADAISQLPTEFERAEASAAIFGRGVAGLQPIIREGAAGIDQIISKADEFGASLSDEQLQAIDAFGDAMNSLGNTMQNLAAGAFADVVIAAQGIIATVRDAVDQIELLAEGGIDALQYMEKAKAGGFATTVQRGEVISRQPYGPNRQATTDRAKATKEQVDSVKRVQKATEELNAEMEETGRQAVLSARIVKDSFADALEEATFDFENFGDAAKNVLDGLARQIARKGFLDPLADSVGSLIFGGGVAARPSPDFVGPMPQDGGLLGGLFGGLGDFFGGFFADGGRPPRDKVSVVGENGPELWVPDSAGTVVPNGGFGGGGVSVTQVFNVSPGIQGTVEAEVRRMAPVIAREAQSGVFRAIERGGRESQLVGKRN